MAAPPALAADTTYTVAADVTQTTAVTASPAAGDTFTIDVDGTLRGSSNLSFTSTVVQGSGAGDVIIRNDGRIQGRFNLSGASGDITVVNNAGADAATQAWHTGGVTSFGTGDDRIENTADGVIATSGSTTFAFGAGSNSFSNAGRLIVDRQSGAGTLTLTGLGAFENSGVILLGSEFNATGTLGQDSDGQFNDRLIAQGVAFTGSAESRIVMDVALGETTQADCAAPTTAADCVDFTGGSTSGSTLLTINVMGGGSGVLNEGVTLVAGSTEAGAFVLDPASDRYLETSRGGALQKGLAAYRLVYDEAGQRHMLVGKLADEALQTATFAAVAQETWRAATGDSLARLADLRAAPGGLQAGDGLWLRVGGASGDRDVAAAFDGEVYDVSHTHRTAVLVGGADLLSGSGGDSAWVVGGTLGFVRGDVEYDATPTDVIVSGFTGGLYATYDAGPLFVDAVLNAGRLDLRADMSNLGLEPGVKLTQEVESLGARIEAGWRVRLADRLFVEPLAGVSYVQTDLEAAELPGAGAFGFDSYRSARYGAGLRLGMDSRLLGAAASYSLTGRYWNEAEGEGVVSVRMPDDAVFALADEFSGGFGELAAGLNLSSEDGDLSGFIAVGGTFADDYRSASGSAGVRLRW